MITPDIRYFHSPDVEDLAGYQPADAQRFSLLLQMLIGPRDGEGEESFDVLVVTPRWLEDRCSEGGPVSGQDLLVVCSYDWLTIERYLRARVEKCAGANWREVGKRIGRFSVWEFQDYTE